MGDLNEDLILLIFSKLPLKTLFRFKCLSKHWLELLLLTTNSMVMQHREQSKKNPKVLLLHDDRVSLSSMKLQELDHDPDHDRDAETILLHNQFTAFLERTSIEILPCSKGEIVCLAATANSLFYVCNPSTRELVCLPEPSPFTLGGDPDSAFGYIPSKDEYKLVHLYTHQYGGITRGEMFTLSSDREKVGSQYSWKVIEDECPHEVQGNGVMVDNSFYWVTHKEEQHGEDEERISILSFDVETETFGTIACPPEGCEYIIKQVELEGSLCVVDNFLEHSTMVLWILKDDSSGGGENNNTPSWERKYSIYVPVPVHVTVNFMEDIFPVYDRDGEIILHDMKKSVYYYNIKTEKLRRVANRIITKMDIGLYIDGPFPLRKWIIEYP